MAGNEHDERMLRLELQQASNLSTEQLVEVVIERLRRTNGQALPEMTMHELALVAFDKLQEQTP